MLKGLCKFLDGLGSVDDGVESVLSPTAFAGLIELVETVYGTHTAIVIEGLFIQRVEGSMVMVIDNPSEGLMLCLTGKG